MTEFHALLELLGMLIADPRTGVLLVLLALAGLARQPQLPHPQLAHKLGPAVCARAQRFCSPVSARALVAGRGRHADGLCGPAAPVAAARHGRGRRQADGHGRRLPRLSPGAAGAAVQSDRRGPGRPAAGRRPRRAAPHAGKRGPADAGNAVVRRGGGAACHGQRAHASRWDACPSVSRLPPAPAPGWWRTSWASCNTHSR